MEYIATVTPTRGDRKKFFEFCGIQIDKQTLQPTNKYFIAFNPDGPEPDLTKRVRGGYELAKKDGMDWIIVWEDDDCMPSNYIETLSEHFKDYDFVGYSDTLYYNIRNRTWMHQYHSGRSSLFCTAFRIGAMEDFIWPADHYLWLDLRIWDHARDKRKKVKLMTDNPCVGIKHNVGMVAGKAHRLKLENKDPGLQFLKSKVEDYQYQFYKSLMF